MVWMNILSSNLYFNKQNQTKVPHLVSKTKEINFKFEKLDKSFLNMKLK